MEKKRNGNCSFPWGCWSGQCKTGKCFQASPSSFFVNQPISSATNHENTAFKARPNTLRESGSFSCSELFISTNHCTASPAFCPCTFSIFTKTPAISLFMDRFAWNSELKLLSASCFEPRGHFLVLFVRLFVDLDTAKLFLNWFWFSLGLPFRSVKRTMISVNFFQFFKGFTLLPWQKVGRILLGFAGNPSNFQISPLFACISLQLFPSLSLCIRTINVWFLLVDLVKN